MPPGTPRWGAKWKQATKDGYGNAMGFGSQGSSYPVRENYLDLDPTYRDRHGRPLLRITFDFPDNDVAMSHYLSDQLEKMVKPFNAKYTGVARLRKGWDSVPYQSTHNTGGAIMGLDPTTSAVNKLAATPIVSVTPNPLMGPVPMKIRMIEEIKVVTWESKMVPNARS